MAGYCTADDVKTYLKGLGIDAIFSDTEINNVIDQYADEIDELSGTAWREKTVTDEVHSIRHGFSAGMWYIAYAIMLNYAPVRQITSLQVFNGTEYEEWVGNKEEGRGKDYYIDYKDGFIYIMGYRWILWGLDVKVSYTYGYTSVDGRVKELNTLYAVRHLLQFTGAYEVSVPEGGTDTIASRMERVERRIKDLEQQLKGYRNIDEGMWVW